MNKKIFAIFSILLGLILLTSCGNRQPKSLAEHINLVIKEQSAEMKQQQYDEIFSRISKKDIAECMFEMAKEQNINENNEIYKSLQKYDASDLDGGSLTSLAYISMTLTLNFYSCTSGRDP